MRRFVVAAVVLTALVVVGGVVVIARNVAPIATGYAAQIGCGVVLLQDRPVDAVVDDLPANPLRPLLRVSESDGVVEATLLGAFGTRAAPSGDGGCQQLGDDEPVPTVEVAPMDPPADDLVVPTSPATEAANAGLDVDRLEAAVTGAFADDPDPDTVLETRAVVVVHRGTVVAERYADGFDETTPLLGWSMTKSVADAMVGRLALAGVVDTGEPVPGIWPADDPRARITWDELLSMTDGLEFAEVYDIGTDATTMLFTGIDTGEFAADKPLQHEPGTVWSYSSGTTNILCDAVVDVAGTDPALAARELVFEPLAMTSATLGTDGDAPVCSSFGYATARDWARFGLLYEQDGVWGGERLLPDGWVARTTTPLAVPMVEDGDVTPYGRQWWLNDDGDGGLRMPSVPADAFWASGNEGQAVVVVPSRDLVVVRLGFNQGVDGLAAWLEGLVDGAVAAVDASSGGGG